MASNKNKRIDDLKKLIGDMEDIIIHYKNLLDYYSADPTKEKEKKINEYKQHIIDQLTYIDNNKNILNDDWQKVVEDLTEEFKNEITKKQTKQTLDEVKEFARKLNIPYNTRSKITSFLTGNNRKIGEQIKNIEKKLKGGKRTRKVHSSRYKNKTHRRSRK